MTEDEYYNGGSNAAAAQETIDEISPQEKAELEAKVTGKPHMNLMGSRPSEPETPKRMSEPEPEPVSYEEPPAGEETVMAPTGNDAVDYFNSLPESVRKMILNSDE